MFENNLKLDLGSYENFRYRSTKIVFDIKKGEIREREEALKFEVN